MTDEEAIEKIKEKYYDSEYYFAENDEYEKDFDEDLHEAYEIMICLYKELKQYRALGTMEEIKELKERALRGLEIANTWATLEEPKKYKGLGTVEKLQEATEKQKLEKPYTNKNRKE